MEKVLYAHALTREKHREHGQGRSYRPFFVIRVDQRKPHRPAETTARPETKLLVKRRHMANTMEEFEALLEESFEIDTPQEGSVVKGKVIAIEAGQAIIDVGY